MTRLFDSGSPRGRGYVALAYALVTVAFLAGYAHAFAAVNPVVPDSRGYLYFSPDRTIGYQLFLALLGRVSVDLSLVRIVQLLIVGGSTLLAAYALFRRTGSVVTGGAFLVVALGYPAPMKTAMQVTTEGLSMACAAAFVAIHLADAHRTRRWATPAMAGLLLVATAVRPTNIGLLLGGLLALWLCGRHRGWRSALVLCAAVLLGMLATPAAQGWLSPGRPSDSAAARGLFGAALLAPGRGDMEAQRCGAPAFDAELEPIKEYLAAAPPRMAGYLTLHYTNYMRFDHAIPRIIKQRGMRLRAEANPIMMCYARTRLLRHPRYFVERTARNYWSMASYENYDQPAFNRALSKHLAARPAPLPARVAFLDDPDAGLVQTAPWNMTKHTAHVPVAGETQETNARNPLAPKSGRNIWMTRLLTAAFLAGTGMALFALLAVLSARWRRPAMIDIAVFGIVIHAVLFVTAVFEIPLMRYLYPVWPLIALIALRPLPAILRLAAAGSRRVPWRRT